MDTSNREVHAREIAVVALILRLAELWPERKLWEDHFGRGFEWHVTTSYGTPGLNVGDTIGVVVRSRGWQRARWYYEIACCFRKAEAGWMPDNGHLACVLASGGYHGQQHFCSQSPTQPSAPPFPHLKEYQVA